MEIVREPQASRNRARFTLASRTGREPRAAWHWRIEAA
jgi:hypothetical protein